MTTYRTDSTDVVLTSGSSVRGGRIADLWRYPVSSIGGEQVNHLSVSTHGVLGDRQFCLYDALTGLPASPEKEPRWRPSLFLTSRRLSDELPEIGLGSGSWYRVDDPNLDGLLTDHFGFEVRVGEHPPADGARKTSLQAIEGRYRPSPFHLLSNASLVALSQLCGLPSMDSRRFRANAVIDFDNEIGFAENALIDSTLRLGGVFVKVVEDTKRCGMTLIAQPGIEENPDVLRNVLRHNKRNLGVYCEILSSGVVSVGDAIYVVSDASAQMVAASI